MIGDREGYLQVKYMKSRKIYRDVSIAPKTLKKRKKLKKENHKEAGRIWQITDEKCRGNFHERGKGRHHLWQGASENGEKTVRCVWAGPGQDLALMHRGTTRRKYR